MPAAAPDHDADAARVRLVEAIVATAAEDRAAFRQLYRLTSAKLFGVCLRICGTREAAEEVLQEVYLLVWRRAGAFEPGRASPITWLSAIARNRAIDWRRARTHQHPSVGAEEAMDVPDPAPGAADAMLADEGERRLHWCLDQLSDEQKGAIRTAFFGGRTYAELAQAGSIPVGTVKSWIRRGLARLRECLGDDA